MKKHKSQVKKGKQHHDTTTTYNKCERYLFVTFLWQQKQNIKKYALPTEICFCITDNLIVCEDEDDYDIIYINNKAVNFKDIKGNVR